MPKSVKEMMSSTVTQIHFISSPWKVGRKEKKKKVDCLKSEYYSSSLKNQFTFSK